MVKWKSKRYIDLVPFDVVSLESLIKRSKNTLIDVDKDEFMEQHKSGRALIKFNVDNLEDKDVNYYHNKFNGINSEIPTKTQIVLHQYKPEFSKPEYNTEINKKIFEGNVSNFNNRDGFVVGGFSEIDLYSSCIKYKNDNKTTGEWLYLEIPYHYFYDYIGYSVNNSPLNIVKKFVETINERNINDIEEIKKLVSEFDQRFPHWNHDFPIKGYFQVKKEGLLFPSFYPIPNIFLDRGTHKLVMTTFNKFDFPIFIQIPKKYEYRWYSQSREPMFVINGKRNYLLMFVDRYEEILKFEFTQNKDESINRNEKLT